MQEQPVEIVNNFQNFKEDFKKDTGLEFSKENMGLYMQYVNTRMSDISAQTLQVLTHKLINKVNFLPDQIRLRIAEMITDHPVIKEVRQEIRKKNA